MVRVPHSNWSSGCSNLLCGAPAGSAPEECLYTLLLDPTALRVLDGLDQCLLHSHQGEAHLETVSTRY